MGNSDLAVEEDRATARPHKEVPAPTIEGPKDSPSPPAAPAQLPAELVLHKFTDHPVPGDRPIRIAHAGAGNRTPIVYLHGMCGNPKGADPWVDLATQYGTVVVVRATIPCKDRPGYRWPQEPELIQPRIIAALEIAQQQREGQLDLGEIPVIGYSQGAHRAEKLAAAYPEIYQRLVLGGPPTSPTPEKLHGARRVAVLGGELENTDHMLDGQQDLVEAGLKSRFFLLPRAHHGAYGPEGRRVMTEVLGWLFALPSPSPSAKAKHSYQKD